MRRVREAVRSMCEPELMFGLAALLAICILALGFAIVIVGHAVSAVNCLVEPESARCTLLHERDKGGGL